MDKSYILYERSKKSVSGGVHSNSRSRFPYPLYFSKADGAYIWDVDGNRYIDLGMGNGSILLGHNHPAVQTAVSEALLSGLTTGLESEFALNAAELFVKLVPSAERVRFTNTGTEAIMHALHIARCCTKRQKIAKVEGAYHGWSDHVFVSTWPPLDQAGPPDKPIPVPGTRGLSEWALKDVIVLPFNDVAATEEIIKAHASELAAILVEPTMIDVGFIPADYDYLKLLRDLADEIGSILIFDELLTGFRLALGGAQAKYEIQADLATFGKAIGNGYPVALLSGKADLMEFSLAGHQNTTFVGTFNGHAVIMAAVLASLEQISDGRAIEVLQSNTEKLIQAFQISASRHHISAQMQGGGGHIHWYFSEEPVRNYRQAAQSNRDNYSTFIKQLQNDGFMVTPNYLLHHAISLAHGMTELDTLIQSMNRGLAEVARK